MLGVDTAGAEKEQPLHPGAVSLVNDVGLNQEILRDEVGGIRSVSQDSADTGSSKENVVWLFGRKKVANRFLVRQIQFVARADDEILEAESLKTTRQHRTHQALMAGYVDFLVRIHRSIMEVIDAVTVLTNELVALRGLQVGGNHFGN